MDKTKESKSASYLGYLGGKAVLKKKGRSYFSKLAKKRWNKLKKKSSK